MELDLSSVEGYLFFISDVLSYNVKSIVYK